MKPPVHLMNLEADNGAEKLYVCPEPDCGRQVVFHGSSGRMVVLQQGDFYAFHKGGSFDLTVVR